MNKAAIAAVVTFALLGGLIYLVVADVGESDDKKTDSHRTAEIEMNKAYVTIIYESDHMLTCNCTLSATDRADVTVDIPGYSFVTKSYTYEWPESQATMDVTARMHARGALGDKFDYETITLSDGQLYTIRLKA